MRHPVYSIISTRKLHAIIPCILKLTGLAHIGVAASIVVLAACAGEITTEEHIARAQKYIEESDYRSASIELKNALKKQGTSAEARWLLGSIYLETGDAASAEKELLRARELGWNLNDVSPALAEAQLALADYPPILEIPHDGLESFAAIRVLSAKVIAELARGNMVAAETYLKLAQEKETPSTHLKMAEARVMVYRGDLVGADIVLNEALELDSDLAEAWSLKGNILMQQKEWDGALAAFDKAIELSDRPINDLVDRALINFDLQNYDLAQADIDRVLKAQPKNPEGNYIRGLLFIEKKQYSDAISSLSLAEPAAQSNTLILYYLAYVHLLEGHISQGAEFASRFFSLEPDNISGRKLLAAVKLKEGEHADVVELMQPVLDLYPEDVSALNLMANALLGAGKTDQALDALTRVAKLQPDSATAQLRLGVALSATNSGVAAVERFEEALKLDPDNQQADVLLILDYALKEDFEKATEAAKDYIERHPDSVAPYNLLGKVLLNSGNRQDAIAAFEQALDLDPGDPMANHFLARMVAADGDSIKAREHYQTTLEYYPNNLRAMLGLAYIDASEQKEQDFVKQLQSTIETHPRALSPRVLMARYYLANGEWEKVSPLFEPLDNLQKNSNVVLRLEALAQLGMEQHADAGYTLQQLMQSTGETPQLHHMQALAAAGRGDQARARSELEKAVALDEEHVPSLVILARLAQRENNIADFREYLDKLNKLAPDHTDVLRLRAAEAYRTGEKSKAVDLASQAFATLPTSQTMLELALYQRAAGNDRETLRILRQWVEDNPEDVRSRLALADYFENIGKLEDANEHYKFVLELEPDNLTALNNLAWNMRKDNKEQALEYIRQAALLAPDVPEVQDSLAVIEHLNGENRLAHRSIQRALAAKPDNPSMLYHKAMIESALGENSAAIALLEELLAPGAPTFPEREEARNLLSSLKG